MSISLFLTCSLLLINFQSAFLLHLNRPNNVQYGQEEYYYPSYYDYVNDNIEKVDTDLLGQRLTASIQNDASRFPSLLRPEKQGVSVEGPNRFTKYKNYRPQSRNEDVSSSSLLESLISSRNVVNDNNNRFLYYPKIQTNRDNNEYNSKNEEVKMEPKKEVLRAMKKVYNQKNIKNALKRMALNEDVLESNMYEHPKSRRKSEVPALKQTSSDFYTHPQSYHQTFNSNHKQVSLLNSISDFYFIVIVVCVSSVAIFSVIGAGYCFYKVQQQPKDVPEGVFTNYGVVGPACVTGNITPTKDRMSAQSAQMYHYEHQKQQMISNEKKASIPKHPFGSDIESDEENEDGEYTVYECPGLAPTGEMEVKNPLFQDDLTPLDSPAANKLNVSKETKN